MNTPARIEIPLNKSRILLMLAGCGLFVAIGFWFVIAPPTIENSYWGHPAKLAVIGSAAIVFFGLCAFVLARKARDNKPGLIIDTKGLFDNSGGLAAGEILWCDVENISVLEIQKHRMLMLYVSNPNTYIDRQKNLLKRKGMALNHRSYGTPVSISASTLKISFPELFALVSQRFGETRPGGERVVTAIEAGI